MTQFMCKECGCYFFDSVRVRGDRIFCSMSCSAIFRNRSRIDLLKSIILAHDSDECLLSPFSPLRTGHTRVTIGGKKILLHRFAWQVVHGDVPDGLFVLHKCDVRPCFSPRHLFLGTNDDNMKDMASKSRSCRGYVRSTLVRLISGNRIKKLINDGAVRSIRARVEAGELQTSIADEYGVAPPVISVMCSRKTWKHVS